MFFSGGQVGGGQSTYHPSVQLDRETAFVAEVNRYFIPLSDQIQLLWKGRDMRITGNELSMQFFKPQDRNGKIINLRYF